MQEKKSVPFGTFLQNDKTYKSICDGFSERFNLLFVTVLDYCHQMDLHVMQQQTEESEELDSAQEKLSACMNYIRPHVEETYQYEVEAAFDAFKDSHKNDKPACSLSEFQQLLDAFLIMVETQKNLPPPPTHTQKQQAPFSFSGFLEERFSGLVSAIGQDQRLNIEDRNALSFFILVLGRDSVDQTIDLTNKGVFGPQGIQNPAVLEYMNALRGAYAVYMGMCSHPEYKKECIIELNLISQEREAVSKTKCNTSSGIGMMDCFMVDGR